MAAAEREAFEQRLIAEDQFSEAVENDQFHLLEDYAAGVLVAEDSQLIDAWIADSPEARRLVAIARGLHRAASRRRPGWQLWIGWGVPAAVCAVFAALLLFVHDKRAAQPPISLATSVAPARSVREDTILLIAERLRGGGRNDRQSYTVHAGDSVRLQIIIPPSGRDAIYSASIRGKRTGLLPPLHPDIVRGTGDAGAPYLEVSLPPGALLSDHYELELHSREGAYWLSFDIVLE